MGFWGLYLISINQSVCSHCVILFSTWEVIHYQQGHLCSTWDVEYENHPGGTYIMYNQIVINLHVFSIIKLKELVDVQQRTAVKCSFCFNAVSE